MTTYAACSMSHSFQDVPFFAGASRPPFICNGVYARAPNISAVIGHGDTVRVSGGSAASADDDASSLSGSSSFIGRVLSVTSDKTNGTYGSSCGEHGIGIDHADVPTHPLSKS